jgi:hypothetical protein
LVNGTIGREELIRPTTARPRPKKGSNGETEGRDDSYHLKELYVSRPIG